VLCELPTRDGSPCNSCPTCQQFAEGRSWGYIELDVLDGQAEERARELVTLARKSSLADRCVIVIANADAYAPQAFDVLLKTLEETSTTFVFLACAVRKVRLAGRSRCDSVRLRPLDQIEAREHLRALCAAHGVTCDERVLDVLVAAGLGLPGRSREVCARVADVGELTLETARSALGLDWVDDMAASWHVALSDEKRFVNARALSAEIVKDEEVRRVRVFLQYLYLYGLREPPIRSVIVDPALLHLDDTLLTKLVAVFRRRADALGVSSETLWHTLAEHWLSGDRSQPGLAHWDETSGLSLS
jgi:hypothetical protein